MKKLKILVVSLLFVGGLALLLPSTDASAVNVFNQACSGNSDSTLCSSRGDSADSMVAPIVSLLLWAVGIVSVIVIIVGGIMYAASAGDPGRAKKAKDAILYAVVGLVVAIMSYGIVTFVVDRIAPASGSSSEEA